MSVDMVIALMRHLSLVSKRMRSRIPSALTPVVAHRYRSSRSSINRNPIMDTNDLEIEGRWPLCTSVVTYDS